MSVLFLHNSFIVFIHSLEQGVGGVCAMLSWLNQSYATCDARRRWRAIKSESNDYFALAVDLIKPQYLHISHLADLTHTHTPRQLWRLVWWFQLPLLPLLLFLLPCLHVVRKCVANFIAQFPRKTLPTYRWPPVEWVGVAVGYQRTSS